MGLNSLLILKFLSNSTRLTEHLVRPLSQAAISNRESTCLFKPAYWKAALPLAHSNLPMCLLIEAFTHACAPSHRRIVHTERKLIVETAMPSRHYRTSMAQAHSHISVNLRACTQAGTHPCTPKHYCDRLGDVGAEEWRTAVVAVVRAAAAADVAL